MPPHDSRPEEAPSRASREKVPGSTHRKAPGEQARRSKARPSTGRQAARGPAHRDPSTLRPQLASIPTRTAASTQSLNQAATCALQSSLDCRSAVRGQLASVAAMPRPSLTRQVSLRPERGARHGLAVTFIMSWPAIARLAPGGMAPPGTGRGHGGLRGVPAITERRGSPGVGHAKASSQRAGGTAASRQASPKNRSS